MLPSGPRTTLNTQLATGKYTSVAHTPAKTIHAPNFARSATAPEMRATAIMAKVAWKAANARGGSVAPGCGVRSALSPRFAQSIESTPGNPDVVPDVSGK